MTDQQLTPGALTWTDLDRDVLSNVESCLATGLELKHWWELTGFANAYQDRFELTRTFNQPDTTFGFFDEVEVRGHRLPVMGAVDDLLYDQSRHPPTQSLRDQLREFVLHYFLRISAFEQPESTFDPKPQFGGFGYSQHYYKLLDSGFIGKFPESSRFAITDLREIGEKYRWIVAKVHIFDFNIVVRPLGLDAPQIVIPLNEESYLVLSPDFIFNRQASAPNTVAEYGFGYAFLTRTANSGVLAYGPGHFEAAFELIQFRLLSSGEIRVHLTFIANRPRRLLNLSLNPVDWTFKLAGVASFGLTDRLFGSLKNLADAVPGEGPIFDPFSYVDREWLDKRFLLQHFQQHYQMITGSLLTWRQIPNWLDADALPAWVLTGTAS